MYIMPTPTRDRQPRARGATGRAAVPRRMSTPGSGSPRRAEVLQHAAECFAAAGYRGTSMRDIAEASGLLAGSLYSHFASKLQMLEELMTSFFDVLLPRQRAAYAKAGTVGERFTAMVGEVVDVCAAHREVVMVIELDWHDIADMPELADIVARGRESSLLFRRVLDEGVASGEVRADVDLDCVVRLIHSAIYGLLDRRFRLTGPGGHRVEDFTQQQVVDTLEALFGGGLLQPPPEHQPTRRRARG